MKVSCCAYITDMSAVTLRPIALAQTKPIGINATNYCSHIIIAKSKYKTAEF